MSSLSRALVAATLAAAAFLGPAAAFATEQPSLTTPGTTAPAPSPAPFEIRATIPVVVSTPSATEAPLFDFPAPDPSASGSGWHLLSWYAPPPFMFEGAS